MTCGNCGYNNQPDAKFCRNCGQRVIAGGAPVSTNQASVPLTPVPASQPAEGQFNPQSLPSWVAEAKRLGWKKLWPLALLVVYVLWSKNIWVIVVGFGVAWVIRRYSDKIDQALGPIWPHRDRIPRRTRKILAWVVPVVVTLLITLNPPIWPMLGWLPIVGPQGSLTIFTALFAALSAYIFVREPRQVAAR